jgi:EpsI family protein
MEAERRLKHFQIIFLVLLVAVVLVLWLDINQGKSVAGIDLSLIPEKIGAWEGGELPKSDEDQKRAEGGDFVLRKYTFDEEFIYLVAIQERGDRHRVHSPLNCYTGSGWNLLEKKEVKLRSGVLVRRLLVQKADAYRLVYYWFTDGATHSTGFLEHLLLYAKSMVLGRNDTAWVYFDVSADVTESIKKTEALMTDFVAGMNHRQLFERGAGQVPL